MIWTGDWLFCFFFLRECMTASSVCIISYIIAWVIVSSMNLLSGRLSIWQAYNPAPPPAQEFGSLRVAWSRTGQWLNLVGEYLEKCYRFSFYSTVLETGDRQRSAYLLSNGKKVPTLPSDTKTFDIKHNKGNSLRDIIGLPGVNSSKAKCGN